MPGTQALVAVNPITLIASICNLFIQLFIFKKFFWDKVMKVIDQRREAADQEIAQAKSSRSEADAMKAAYEQDMKEARDKADEIVMSAQKAATARSEEIISQARTTAAQIKEKASADIAMEKEKAINDAKNEISGLAMAIAGKVVERELNSEDHSEMINRFISELGEGV